MMQICTCQIRKLYNFKGIQVAYYMADVISCLKLLMNMVLYSRKNRALEMTKIRGVKWRWVEFQQNTVKANS